MDILFLSHYFPPEGNAPASRVSELCRRWVAAGHSVRVITGVPNVPNGVIYDSYRNRLWQWEAWQGVQVLRVWTYLATNSGTVRRTLNYLSFMVSSFLAGLCVRRPDVVLATSPQFFCGWAGALTAWFRCRPFILEIRDIWPESIEAVGAVKNRMAIQALGWLEQRLYRSAHRIVTVGAGYRSRLIQRGVSSEKIDIVMNGVDRQLFLPDTSPARVRAEFGLDGKFVCAYVGTVGMASGLDILLRAGRALRDQGNLEVVFLVVGDGAVAADLKRQARELGLSNVVFVCRQPKERIPEFIAAADVCLVHLKAQALFESVMPSKIFEALALARPVILGVRGFAAEFLETTGGGLCIEPENARQLNEAVQRLRDNPELARQFGTNGQRYVLERFDRDSLAADYLAIIKAVCGQAPGIAATQAVRR